MKGKVHIYCGDGKGKTTMAVGLTVRAAGRGKKVLVTRFLKSDDSGEVSVLKSIPGVTVTPCKRVFGFTWNMSQKEKEEAYEYFSELLKESVRQAVNEAYDMIVLDEIIGSFNMNMIDPTILTDFLLCRPDKLEVVLTGRDPAIELIHAADYVSEVKKVKHPFDLGEPAREGIEY